MKVAFMVVSVWVKGGEGVKGEGLGLPPTVGVYFFFYFFVFISITSGNKMKNG
jgi:hypothetical protein